MFNMFSLQPSRNITIRSNSVASKHTTRTAHVRKRKHVHTVRTDTNCKRWKRHRLSYSYFPEICKISWKGMFSLATQNNHLSITPLNLHVSGLFCIVHLYYVCTSPMSMFFYFVFYCDFFSLLFPSLHFSLYKTTHNQTTQFFFYYHHSLKITEMPLFP